MTDCSEIRNLLSEYLDDALDPKAKALAEEHLRTCRACREELDSLKALVKEVGSIGSVKAPADFLAQLHKRIERPSKRSTVREWLFYPLRVKIPLQLAGAAVIGFIIFSILPLQQPSLKLPSKQGMETKDATSHTEEAKGMIQPAQRPEAPVQQAAPAAPVKDEVTAKPAAKSKALAEKAPPGGPAGERVGGKPSAGSEALVQQAATPSRVKDKETRELMLSLRNQVLPKAATAEPSAAQAPAAPGAADVQRQKLAARAPAEEENKEEAVAKGPEPVLSITKAVEAAKGKVLSVDYDQKTGRPEVVHAEMPAGELPVLYAKLRELGELQVSPPTFNEKDSDLVPVKIRLIDPQ